LPPSSLHFSIFCITIERALHRGATPTLSPHRLCNTEHTSGATHVYGPGSPHTHTHPTPTHSTRCSRFARAILPASRCLRFVQCFSLPFPVSFSLSNLNSPELPRTSGRAHASHPSCMHACACFLSVHSCALTRTRVYSFSACAILAVPTEHPLTRLLCASPCTPAASTVSSQLAISGITSVNLGATNATATFTVTPAITVQHAISVSSKEMSPPTSAHAPTTRDARSLATSLASPSLSLSF
jgi:hypothetical protein